MPLSGSLVARAKLNDQQALATLFGQFLPIGEQIVESGYMGVIGLWGLGTDSFAAVTPRRVASLKVATFGAVEYQDGALEYINSSGVFQPSRAAIYMSAVALPLLLAGGGSAGGLAGAVLGLFLGLLLVPVAVRAQYRLKKSGLVLWVREGLSIYVFIDRKRMVMANRFYRHCAELREERLREIGHP